MSTKKVIINEREYSIFDSINVSQNCRFKLFKCTDSENNSFLLKAISASEGNEEEFKYYKMESRLLDLFKSDFIIKKFGKRELVNNGNRHVAFLIENCSNNLFNILQTHNNAKLKDDTIKKILLEIGNGILYLHHNKFLLGNLNYENIFLAIDGKFKLGELGCCIHETNFSQKAFLNLLIPAENMPPEIKLDEPYISYKIDIWQLGRLLHLLIFKSEPIQNNEYTEQTPNFLITIMNACLKSQPNDRPTIIEILQLITSLSKVKPIDEKLIYNSKAQEEKKLPKPPEQGKPKSELNTKNMLNTLMNPNEEEMNENLMSNLVKNSYSKSSTITKCCEYLLNLGMQSNSMISLKSLIFFHFYLMKGDSKIILEPKAKDFLVGSQKFWKNNDSALSKVIIAYIETLFQFLTVHIKFKQYVDGNTSLILFSFKNASSLSFIPEFLFLFLKLWNSENTLVETLIPLMESQNKLILTLLRNLLKDFISIFRVSIHILILVIKSQLSKTGKEIILAPEFYLQNIILLFTKNYQKMIENLEILCSFSDTFLIVKSLPKNLIEEITKLNHPSNEEQNFNINEIINDKSCFLNITLPLQINKSTENSEENFNTYQPVTTKLIINKETDSPNQYLKIDKRGKNSSVSEEGKKQELFNNQISKDISSEKFPIDNKGQTINTMENQMVVSQDSEGNNLISKETKLEQSFNLNNENLNNSSLGKEENPLLNIKDLKITPENNNVIDKNFNIENNQIKEVNKIVSQNKDEKPKEEKKEEKLIPETDKEIPQKIINKKLDDPLFDIDKTCIAEENDVKFGDVIGYGATAEVYKGLYRGTEVAIKKMKKIINNPQFMKDFKREVITLMGLRHPNLVLFMGMYYSNDSFCVLTEFCAGGNLFSLLHEKINIKLSWKQRYKMTTQIVKGMNYLHSFNPPIIHRDLKSLNILLSEEIKGPNDFVSIKISDFGLARSQINNEEMMTSYAGTFHWMAPEIIENKPYTIKADVYSFSIILWEIICRQTPYQNMSGPNIIYKVGHFDERPNLSLVPQDCPKQLKIIMLSSWNKDPSNRPSFQMILEYLNKEIDNIQN